MNHCMIWALRGAVAVAALAGGLSASGVVRAQPLWDPAEVFAAAPGQLAQPQGAPAPHEMPGLTHPAGGCFRHAGCGAFTAGRLPLATLRRVAAAQDAAGGLGAVEALCATTLPPSAGGLLAWARAISHQRLCAGLREDQDNLPGPSPAAPYTP